MNFVFYDEYIIENLHINVNSRIRDAIHDIMVDKLDYGEEMKITELSELLYIDYNIKISHELLGKLIFTRWWVNKDYTIFKKEDMDWLDVWPYKKTVERKRRKVIKPLGKSRRKLIKNEKEQQTSSWYNRRFGSGGGYHL